MSSTQVSALQSQGEGATESVEHTDLLYDGDMASGSGRGASCAHLFTAQSQLLKHESKAFEEGELVD